MCFFSSVGGPELTICENVGRLVCPDEDKDIEFLADPESVASDHDLVIGAALVFCLDSLTCGDCGERAGPLPFAGFPGLDASWQFSKHHISVVKIILLVINRLMLLAPKRLDHDPLDDVGDVSGGAIACPVVGEGVPRLHRGEDGLFRRVAVRL